MHLRTYANSRVNSQSLDPLAGHLDRCCLISLAATATETLGDGRPGHQTGDVKSPRRTAKFGLFQTCPALVIAPFPRAQVLYA